MVQQNRDNPRLMADMQKNPRTIVASGKVQWVDTGAMAAPQMSRITWVLAVDLKLPRITNKPVAQIIITNSIRGRDQAQLTN